MTNLDLKLTKDDDTYRVTLTGRIDETAEFDALSWVGIRTVVFDFAAVHLYTSLGVKRWISMIQAVPAAVDIQFERCSIATVHQLNQIAAFGAGRARVLSLHVPYYCETCDRTDVAVVDVAVLQGPDGRPVLPARPCDVCGREEAPEAPPARYLMFLRQRPGSGGSPG